MKRLWSLALAAAMLLGLLAGCGDAASSQPAVESEQTSVATAAPEQPKTEVSQAEPAESAAESTLEEAWDPSLPYGSGSYRYQGFADAGQRGTPRGAGQEGKSSY